MAENNKVELDTDDVNETDIAIEEKEQTDTKPEIGEVDLGYNDPIKSSTKTKVVDKDKEKTDNETKEKPEQENLNQVTENVQKRIDQLTRKFREAERREKAALDYAKGLQKKYSDVEKRSSVIDDNYAKEFDARIDAQREQVKHNLQVAIEANDSKAIMEANDKLTQLSVEKEKARILQEQRKQEEEQKKEQPVEQKVQQPEQQPVEKPQASPKAKAWASKNTWFGQDKAMTNAAFGIHADLVEQGFDLESEEYYNEVDKQMRGYFPQKFMNDNKPIQTVASAGRKQLGRKTVTLTRSQVAIAKKLGVPLEEYAKFVKE